MVAATLRRAFVITTAQRDALRAGAGPALRFGGGIMSHNSMQHIALERSARYRPCRRPPHRGARQDQAALSGASVMKRHAAQIL